MGSASSNQQPGWQTKTPPYHPWWSSAPIRKRTLSEFDGPTRSHGTRRLQAELYLRLMPLPVRPTPEMLAALEADDALGLYARPMAELRAALGDRVGSEAVYRGRPVLVLRDSTLLAAEHEYGVLVGRAVALARYWDTPVDTILLWGTYPGLRNVKGATPWDQHRADGVGGRTV